VHCWFGGDRVGIFAAAYRIAFDGWTAEQAIREMKAYHYKEFLHPNLKYYVRKFPERLAKSPALEKYRGMAGRGKQVDAPANAATP
jgi:protein tyrosine/serine phosphatase